MKGHNIFFHTLVGWWFNGPLRQYFSLYRAISQTEGERERREGEMIDESKNVQTTPTRTYCKCRRPLSYCNTNFRTPSRWKFYPAPSHHPYFSYVVAPHKNPLSGMVLMMGHRICFCGEIWLIIPKLSLLNKNNKL